MMNMRMHIKRELLSSYLVDEEVLEVLFRLLLPHPRLLALLFLPLDFVRVERLRGGGNTH